MNWRITQCRYLAVGASERAQNRAVSFGYNRMSILPAASLLDGASTMLGLKAGPESWAQAFVYMSLHVLSACAFMCCLTSHQMP